MKKLLVFMLVISLSQVSIVTYHIKPNNNVQDIDSTVCVYEFDPIW